MTSQRYFSNPRPQMRAFVPASARCILEVGCGDGAFAAGLREERRAAGVELEIWGVERDPAAAARAEAVFDRVICDAAESALADLPDGRFDCVVMNDIIEHIAYPEPLLAGLASHLTPRASLVTSMPNVRFFTHLWDVVVHGDWEYRDDGILDRTHLRFYTRDTMRALLERAGYRVVRQEGINPTRSWRWRLFDLLTLGRARDMQFLQYACLAELVSEEQA